ncbi:MAG: hypothetical protein QM737_18925 [Ferruginibacter sp.]
MVINWILYIAAFIFSSFVILFLVYFFLNLITGRELLAPPRVPWKRMLLTILYIISFVGSYLMFDKVFNYQPPLTNSKTEISNIQTSNSVNRLTTEIQNINSTLSNLNNLTISQIKYELNKTLVFVEKLKEETVNQQKIISGLQNRVIEQQLKAETVTKLAENAESLSKDQLEAITALITSEAKKDNQSSFWIGVLISLPIGILSSLLASALLQKN